MVPREQVINRLRVARYRFKKRGPRVEIYRQQGTGQRVNVTLRDLIDEKHVKIILGQAGLSQRQVEDFLAHCVKDA